MKSTVKSLIYKINIVVDCSDAGVLADFYGKLLGWEWTHPRANGWAAITSPEGVFRKLRNISRPYGLGKKASKDKCFILISMWRILKKRLLMLSGWGPGRRRNSISELQEL